MRKLHRLLRLPRKAMESIPIIPAIRRDSCISEPHQEVQDCNKGSGTPGMAEKEYACFSIPDLHQHCIDGPPSANKVKNNIAKADAMIRFGR